MRKLHIHCGLHKTGTTALQNALHRNAQTLRSQGILFPAAGIPPGLSGHHNIAWQIARDRRFQPAFGDLKALFREIGKFDGDVVLSSEDFESSLRYPERWASLKKLANLSGFDTVFIVYFRDPVAYLESLYIENLKHGFGEEYLAVAQRVHDFGRLNLKEWEFSFDYGQIAAALALQPDAKVIFRDYQMLLGGSVIPDFAAAIGADPKTLGPAAGSWQANKRASPGAALGQFARNRGQYRRAPFGETQRIAEYMCQGEQARLATPARLRDFLESRFLPYRHLVTEVGAHTAPPGLSLPGQVRGRPENDAGAATIDMKKFFSFETHMLIQKLTGLIESRGGFPATAKLDDDLECKINEWRSWIKGKS